MSRIRQKHLLTHTWIFFINLAVSHHVSDPYNNTDLTSEEKIRGFVFNEREDIHLTALEARMHVLLY